MNTLIHYVVLGLMFGLVSGYSLMFTTTVLWAGSQYVYGYDDQVFLYKKRPWYNPFSFEVVQWACKKIWSEKWRRGKWDKMERVRVCWQVFLLICNFIGFWPIIALAAIVCWIILAIKTCLGLVK